MDRLKEVVKKGGLDRCKKLIEEGKRESEKEKGDIGIASIYIIMAMSEIEEKQFIYLDYYTKYIDNGLEAKGEYVGVEERIRYDYEVSLLAEEGYRVSEGIMEKVAKEEEVGEELLEKFNIMRTLNRKMLNISARWHIRRQIEVMEYKKGYKSKKLPKRLPLLQEAIFFADRMIATKMGIKFADGIMPKKMIFAVQPNSGKSFLCNVFCNIGIMLHAIYFKSSGVIRMSNTGSNAEGFSGQCKNMISAIEMKDIYPEMSKYYKENGKVTIFKKEPLDEWLLQGLDSAIRASMFAKGRDSSINGLRNDVALVIDDLSDGADQMNNDEAHKEMVSKYDVDMDSRKEDENIPELIVGTMFNEFDLSNTLIDRAEEKYGELKQLTNSKGKKLFPNSYISSNKEFVVVRVDCFDEDMKSRAPKLISTEKLLDKQREMKPYQFDLVYRQKKASREPRMFEYDTLSTYDYSYKQDLDKQTICVLDPTRKKASDYFVLIAYKKNLSNGKYRVHDVICERQSLGKINDPQNVFANKVVKFLITNRCIELYIENNTSNLIGGFIDEKLKKLRYNSCKISEVYNTQRKEVRIFDMETTIKNNMEFPKRNLYPSKHPMSVLMDIITRFDANAVGKKGNFDDGVDNLSMFAEKYIYSKRMKATIKMADLPKWI